jgi:outer membrane autotransporter protein
MIRTRCCHLLAATAMASTISGAMKPQAARTASRRRASLLACTALGTALGIAVLSPQPASAVCTVSVVPPDITFSGAPCGPATVIIGGVTPFNVILGPDADFDGLAAPALNIVSNPNLTITNAAVGGNNSFTSFSPLFTLGLFSGENITAAGGFGGPITNTGAGAGLVAAAVGNINIVTAATDPISTQSGPGVVLIAGGNIDFTNNATITSTGGSGIFALSLGGDITENVNAKVSSNGLFGAAAISVGGAATVNVNAPIDPPLIGAAAVTIGNNNATVNVNANIDAFLVGAAAVNVLGGGSAIVNVSATGSIGANTAPAFGVVAVDLLGTGDAIAVINGNVQASSQDGVLAIKAFGDGNAIVAGSLDGSVAGTGQIGTALTPVGDDGIQIIHFNSAGNTIVNMAGSIFATDDGISVIRFNGAGDVKVTAGAVTAGDDGIQVIRFNGAGDVAVTANGAINAVDQGIQVIRFNGAGNVDVAANADITSTSHDGIQVIRFNGAGDVNVTAATATTITAADDGIQVIRFNGAGDVNVTAGAINAGDQGIQVIRFNGAGDVNVTANGAITSQTHDGIQVIRFNGDGNVTATNNAAITAPDDGIQVIRFNGDGNVTVNANANITAGDRGIDIFKRAANDPGNDVFVNVAEGATVQGGTEAISINTRVFGVQDSNVTINTAGTLIGAGTFADPTIRILDDGGLVTVNNLATGVIRGDDTLADEVIIRVNASNAPFFTDSKVVITNDGTMVGRMLLFSTVDPIINNNGLWVTSGLNIIGLGANDVLNNTGTIVAGGSIPGTPGTTIFFQGLGNDSVNNSGVIQVDGLGLFIGTNEFNNSIGATGGLLTMINGVSDRGGLFAPPVATTFGTGVGDVTFTTGNFNGANYPTVASRLGVDAVLSGPNNSSSDLLVVGNAVTGKTGIIVNSPGGAGAFNTVGIPVVYVPTGNTVFNNFAIDPASSNFNPNFGTIDKGLFMYFHNLVGGSAADPFCLGSANCQVHVLQSTPGVVANQLPIAITAAQTIFYETALMWEDRQTEVRDWWARGPLVNVRGAGADMPVKARPPVAPPPPPPPRWGVWLKGMGSWADVDASHTQNVGGPVGSFTFDLGYKQDTYAIVGGVDFATPAFVNDVFVFGPMGGYVNSKVRFNQGGTDFKYTGGTVGLSASYLSGGFLGAGGWFADALVKADFLRLSVDSPILANNGIDLGHVDVTTWGVIGNLGYRFNFGPGFFEPIGTLTYARTDIDNINNIALTSLNFGNGDSFRGAIGARLGTRFNWWAGHTNEAWILGRVWDEFAGNNNTIDILNPGVPVTVADNTFNNKAFGEVKAGVDFIALGQGWSAHVNGGAKFNDDFTIWNAKGGVSYKW